MIAKRDKDLIQTQRIEENELVVLLLIALASANSESKYFRFGWKVHALLENRDFMSFFSSALEKKINHVHKVEHVCSCLCAPSLN